jgi:hypothetical protein
MAGSAAPTSTASAAAFACTSRAIRFERAWGYRDPDDDGLPFEYHKRNDWAGSTAEWSQ